MKCKWSSKSINSNYIKCSTSLTKTKLIGSNELTTKSLKQLNRPFQKSPTKSHDENLE